MSVLVARIKATGRRAFLAAGLAAGLSILGLANAVVPSARAQAIEVAAIYTVPVEQQWVSRIHIALQAAEKRGDITYVWSENVANTDYERVMREYAEQGKNLIVGEAFAVERAARKVAGDYPETAFLMGSSFGPAQPNFSVFDNWISRSPRNARRPDGSRRRSPSLSSPSFDGASAPL